MMNLMKAGTTNSEVTSIDQVIIEAKGKTNFLLAYKVYFFVNVTS